MGERFPLPVNMGRVDGRAVPPAELTGRVQLLCDAQIYLYSVNKRH